MFYYLLARNCNMKKNAEEIASITALKYIALLIVAKFVEYRYLESGFFNYYIMAFMVFDIVFSLYRYRKVAEKEARDIGYCTDDVVHDDFSMGDYADEINDIKSGFLKRKHVQSKIYHHNINKDADDYNDNNANKPVAEETTPTSEPNNIIDVNNIRPPTPLHFEDISHNVNTDVSCTAVPESLINEGEHEFDIKDIIKSESESEERKINNNSIE